MKHSVEENVRRNEKYHLARQQGLTGREAARIADLKWSKFKENMQQILKEKKQAKKQQILGDPHDDFSFIQALGLEEI